jgi:hypothetical protein
MGLSGRGRRWREVIGREKILAKEEEHADELTDLLFAVDLDTGTQMRRLYFQDEVPGHSGAGQSVDSQRKR